MACANTVKHLRCHSNQVTAGISFHTFSHKTKIHWLAPSGLHGLALHRLNETFYRNYQTTSMRIKTKNKWQENTNNYERHEPWHVYSFHDFMTEWWNHGNAWATSHTRFSRATQVFGTRGCPHSHIESHFLSGFVVLQILQHIPVCMTHDYLAKGHVF